ncbi:MAG: hypothetical protein IJ087_11780 [Eggerthellaceae bacterium]|nr:hypothetical protein [Eggerthellaceae bacterium]
MNRNYGMFGIGLQPDANAAEPAVSFPASSDSPGIDVSTTTEPARVTNGMRDTTIDRYISGSESTATVTTLAFADMLGLVLYGTLGRIASTGDAAPYTHDIKMGEVLPTLTFTQQVGATDAALQTLDGCKVNSLAIEAEGTTPPSVQIGLAGCAAKWLEENVWNDPDFDADDGYFRTTDAEVLFSLTDGNAVAPPSSVILSRISISVANNVEAGTRFGEVDPHEQQEGAATVTASVEGTTSSTSMYRAVKTGSDTGTNIAKTIVTGALQVTFQHSKHPDWTFVVKLPAIPWTIEAMNVGVEGGPFALNLSTDGAISVSGTSIEFILTNGVESYTE